MDSQISYTIVQLLGTQGLVHCLWTIHCGMKSTSTPAVLSSSGEDFRVFKGWANAVHQNSSTELEFTAKFSVCVSIRITPSPTCLPAFLDPKSWKIFLGNASLLPDPMSVMLSFSLACCAWLCGSMSSLLYQLTLQEINRLEVCIPFSFRANIAQRKKRCYIKLPRASAAQGYHAIVALYDWVT